MPRSPWTFACAGGGEAVDRSSDAESHGAVERGQIGLGLGGNGDALDHEGSW
jgi:hypothetical protein